MNKKHKRAIRNCLILAAIIAVAAMYIHAVHHADYAFCRNVSDDEREQRLLVTQEAIGWLGTAEGSPQHQTLLEIYNSHTPLAQGYTVQPDDNWCAAFVSAMAIECDLTDIIPTECGCQRQIGLWQERGRWEEADDYIPLPGDIIYYCTSGSMIGDCSAWSDHVGIVVGTWHGWIKVIEGNYGNQVAYRYIRVNAPSIRGFGLPDYTQKPASE